MRNETLLPECPNTPNTLTHSWRKHFSQDTYSLTSLQIEQNPVEHLRRRSLKLFKSSLADTPFLWTLSQRTLYALFSESSLPKLSTLYILGCLTLSNDILSIAELSLQKSNKLEATFFLFDKFIHMVTIFLNYQNSAPTLVCNLHVSHLFCFDFSTILHLD